MGLGALVKVKERGSKVKIFRRDDACPRCFGCPFSQTGQMTGRTRSPRRFFAPARWPLVALALGSVFFGLLVPVGGGDEAIAADSSAANSAAHASSADLARSMGIDGFTPGNIISDAVFSNSGTMTEAEIAAFFTGKVSKCTSGYTCLKDFRQTTPTRPADSYCNGYSGGANETAARIIYKVSQSCGINPQVLIVMLQKEQGLITHTWPSQWRYDMALGQGCPDDAPCDPQFAGFFYQMYGAARQMNIYTEGYWFTYFYPGSTWQVQYHPNRGCGTGPVYIENAATSALYYYTPYQPNAAALRAGYGEGDNCSSYGNRNFYNYFTDWFGSTQGGGSTASADAASYVAALDSSGTLWSYPFTGGTWSGSRGQLAEGLSAAKSLMLVPSLNGARHRDVLLHQQGRLLVMRGDRTGFSAPEDLGLDWSNVALSTSAGDLDGDGVPDVLTTTTTGDLILWRGSNRGSFLPPVRVGWGWSTMNLIIGGTDLNRDGNTDIIGRDSSGFLWAFYGNGAGAWLSQVRLGHGWGGMTSLFSPGDFNADGVDDVIARTAGGDLHLYPGDGNGGLSYVGKIGNGWGSMTALSGAGVSVERARPLTAGIGDVDRDGATDVVGLALDGSLNLYRGNGAGSWRGSRQLLTGWSSTDRVFSLGDFNGDGVKDLARITANGDFYLVPGSWTGGYGQPTKIGNGWGGLSLLTGGIDYDGDRKPDVIGRDVSGALVLFRGNGTGGWADGGTKIGYGWGAFNTLFHVGDFDGDGQSDVIARTGSGQLVLYPTSGAGGWGTPSEIGYGWGSFTAIFGPGDFDGNGTDDVLARTVSGDLILYRGNGQGGWGTSTVIGNGWGGLTALG